MSALKIKENIYSVGVMNPALRQFDIIMTAEYGTTYNAFLIKGEKNILIDTVHEMFFDEYFENIESIVPIDKIDVIIMNHTEPDHSGSLLRLLQKNPNILVIASMSGIKFIKNLTNLEFNGKVVKQGETLDTGIGELSFIIAPNLHWPDSMFTYFEEKKIVFTCDFLGAHYCEPRMFDNYIPYPDKYEEAFSYYYECIFAPFKSFVLQGLAKMSDLKFDMVCTSHGPILTESIKKRMDQYEHWSQSTVEKGKPHIAIAYASAYTYTKQLALAAYDELKSDFQVELIDLVEIDACKAAEKIQKADCVFMGSCTINRDAVKPVWDTLAALDAINTTGKVAGVFGCYGWSGEAVPMINQRLRDLKMTVVGEGVRVCFRPSAEELDEMRVFAQDVVSQIKQK